MTVCVFECALDIMDKTPHGSNKAQIVIVLSTPCQLPSVRVFLRSRLLGRVFLSPKMNFSIISFPVSILQEIGYSERKWRLVKTFQITKAAGIFV